MVIIGWKHIDNGKAEYWNLECDAPSVASSVASSNEVYRDVTKCIEMFSDEGRMYRGGWNDGMFQVTCLDVLEAVRKEVGRPPVHFITGQAFAWRVVQGKDMGWCFLF